MSSRPGTPRKKAGGTSTASSSGAPSLANGTPRKRALAGAGAGAVAVAPALASVPVPPSPNTSRVSDALHPSLPRPPTSLSSITCALDHLATSPGTGGGRGGGKQQRGGSKQRKKRSSADERDPSTANSTEDEDEGDNQHNGADVFDAYSANLHRPSPSPIPISQQPRKSRGRSVGPSSPGNEKQNICVCVRVRPSAPGAAEETTPIWKLDPAKGRISITDHHPIMEKRKAGVVNEELYDYTFDSLLLPPCTTDSLYTQRISPIVKAAMEGYNATVFSYGQTGSGKTHTMMGNDDEPGIIPQAILEVFNYIKADPDREFLLRISYLESYNETLRDLLCPPGEKKDKELRIHEDPNGRIVVNGLREEIVSSPVGVFECIMKGEKNRSVAGTDWNLRSSRSHCVLSMIIESRPRSAAFSSGSIVPSDSSASLPSELPYTTPSQSDAAVEVRISQLNLIDLAGSEKATSQEERRKEGAFINKSLLSLGIVIAKLAEGKDGTAHIPYRDSKLTRLLQTSLSGNARIAIICTISPEARHGVESVNTLKFAQRASKVVTKAERGVILGESGALIAKYEKELDELRARLQRNDSKGRDPITDEHLEDERSKRQKAETEAEDYRLEVLRLREQIDALSGQIITSSTASAPVNYNVPADEEDDEDEPIHARPTGTRPKRRISGLAFGLGTPLGKLAGQTASVRSFSSNLETIKSPSFSNLDRVHDLEKELEQLKSCREKVISEGAEEVKTLKERIEKLQSELIHVHEKMEAAIKEKDSYIQEAGEQASANMKLQRQLDAAVSQSGEDRSCHQLRINQLEAEVETGKCKIETLGQELAQATKNHERQVEILHSELKSLTEVNRERAEKLTAMEESITSQRAFESDTVAALQAELAAAKREAETLRAEKLVDQQKIDAILTEQAENELKMKKLVVEINEKDNRVLEVSAERDAMSAEIEQLKRVVKEQSAVMKEQEEEIEGLNSTMLEEAAASEKTIAGLKKSIADETSAHLEQLAKLRHEADATITALRAEVGKLNDLTESQGRTILEQKEELEKKELTRAQRTAMIKASTAPPNFSALQAKIHAASNRSGISPGAGSRSLSSSSNSSHGGATGVDSEVEAQHAKAISSLENQVAALKEQLQASRTQESESQETIVQLEARIAELENAIETFRAHVLKQGKMIEELQNRRSPSPEPPRLVQSPRHNVSQSPIQPSTAVKAPFSPLNARSHFKSASANLPSRPSTPSKQTYINSDKPQPLPTPETWASSPKLRRLTREHELEQLREKQTAGRAKSVLLSPRSQREKEWASHQQHTRSRTISTMSELENTPPRIKKSSGDPFLSQY